MPLPTTTATPLTMSAIQTEFGGSDPIELTEYYAGGSYVNAGTTGTYGAVPSSGAISINNFYGTQAKYTIANSLRFRKAGSAYLSRTFGSGNVKKWTFSAWVKRGLMTANSTVDDYYTLFGHLSQSDKVFFYNNALWFYVGAGAPYYILSQQLFRDPSAWYHIVAILDTDAATASDRMYLFVNGVRITAFSGTAYPTQGYTGGSLNTAASHHIGRADTGNNMYFDGHMAEIRFLDGIATGPNDFGYTDTNGVWQPKSYTGSYGTNGFYLKFNDGTSATTLCYDRSGNNNHWTPNNISTTTGVTYDWMSDSPTNNYCTLNAVDKDAYENIDANLRLYGNATGRGARGTIGVTSGKWYWEVQLHGSYGAGTIGLCNSATPVPRYDSGNAWVVYTFNGNKFPGNTGWTSAISSSDLIGVAFDADAGNLYIYKNNSLIGTLQSGLTSGPYFPYIGDGATNPQTYINFGQRPFSYTPPSGFVALCTANLPTVAITNPRQHFDAKTYVGNGATTRQVVSGNAFQPGFVWIKERAGQGFSHHLYDVVRGVGSTKDLITNQITAEGGDDGVWGPIANIGYVSAFNSDGFTTATNSVNYLNYNGSTYVSWLWKANGTGVTNTAGTITSTVSANTTAGFSIVTYTGNGSTNNAQTVGHGLGVVPAMVIVKARGEAESWFVKHKNLSSNHNLVLSSTLAQTDVTVSFSAGGIANLSSSTTFGLINGTNGSATNVNRLNITYVAYCFAEIPGYSKFGSYTANNSYDGPFIYTGHSPRFVLLKDASVGSDWWIFDSARDTYNVVGTMIYPNASAAEVVTPPRIDFLSNGFKVRIGSAAHPNNGSDTYIYASFAALPFGGSNTYPANAR